MRHLNRALTTLVLVYTLFVFSQVFAATIFVDVNAPPGGDGLTLGTAFQTIQEGVDAASPTDLVQVAPGIYSQTTNRSTTVGFEDAVVFMQSDVDVVGSGIGSSVISGIGNEGAHGAIFDGVSNATITGFSIQNFDVYYATGAGVYHISSAGTIDGNEITSNAANYTGAGIAGGAGISVIRGGSATITNNLITGNSGVAGAGVLVYYADALLQGNDIYLNNATDLGGGVAVYGGAGYLYQSYGLATATLDGNFIDLNSATQTGGGVVTYAATVDVSNGTIIGNNATIGGGIFSLFSALTLDNNTLDSNATSYGRGGGAYLSYTSATITGGTISGNDAQGGATYGGGAFLYDSVATISGTTINGNQAQYGGGVSLYESSARLTNVDVANNVAYADGGGLLADTYSRLEITGGEVSNNIATVLGGGIGSYDYSTLIVDTVFIAGNQAGSAGGGIYGYFDTQFISNTTITGNYTAGRGGGIYQSYGLQQLTNSAITTNTAGQDGGGLYLYSNKATVTGNRIEGNNATYEGGGVHMQSECTSCFDEFSVFITFSNNLVFGNRSLNGDGGGIWTRDVTVGAITNNTMTGNQADSGRGGGMYIDRSYNLYLQNNIIEGNTASSGGGVYHDLQGTYPPVITGNDITGNTPDNWATLPLGGGVADPTGANGNVDLDPAFVGPGTADFRLQAGSPAVDAGDAAAVGLAGPDLDGSPRVQDGDGLGGATVDMGAYELAASGANASPVAIVRAGRAFRNDTTIRLDGSRSFDPNGDALTYRWSQTGGPPVTLSSTIAPSPTITALGTPRSSRSDVYGINFLPTSLFFDLTVSDGATSDTARLEVRIGETGTSSGADLTGFDFGHELGIAVGHGIAFTPDGSEVLAIDNSIDPRVTLFRAPVVRDGSTSRIRSVGPFQVDTLLASAQHLDVHPSGTVLASTTNGGLRELPPSGPQGFFDLTPLGFLAPDGLTMVPATLPATGGRLLIADNATLEIYMVDLQSAGGGLFQPVGPRVLYADLSQLGVLGITGLGFVDNPQLTDLYFTDRSSNNLWRISIDTVTGFPTGGAASPLATLVYSDLGSWMDLAGLAADPLGDTLLIASEQGRYPENSIVEFQPTPVDYDNDGTEDATDNCPTIGNPLQEDTGGAPGVGDACDNVAQLLVDLEMTKSHAGDFTEATQGTYILAVFNLGNEAEPGPITVTDTLPAGLTYVTTTSGDPVSCGASGQDITCFHPGPLNPGFGFQFNLIVDVGSAAIPSVINTATVSGTEPDGDLANNTANDPTTVLAAGGPSADLSVTKTDSPDPVLAGTTLTYSLVVANAGPDPATNVVLSDIPPALLTGVTTSGCSQDPNGTPTCNLGTIASGGNAAVTITGTVSAAATGTLTNTATVASDETDPNPGDNSATAVTTVTPVGPDSADLSISKIGSPDPVLAGGAFTYTVTVDNLGPDDAVGVVVTDTVPAFLTGLSTSGCAEDNLVGVPTCTLGTIVAQGSASYTISGVISPAAIGNMSNTASVASSTSDPNAANNSTTIVTEIDDKPIADAGADTRGTTGSTLVLDGSGSSDPEAQPLTYRWRQVSGNTFVPIATPSSPTTSINVSQVTPTDLLTFALDVDDGASGVVTDFVNVQIVPFPEWHRWRHDSRNTGVTPSQGPAVQSSNLSVTFPGAVRSSVSFDFNDGMYVGNDDGNLYALNLDGTVRWAFPTGGPVRTTPLVVNGRVYFGSMDGNLYAVDQATGIQSWSFNGGAGAMFRFSSPVQSSGFPEGISEVIAGTSEGLVVALDEFDGTERWRFQAGGAVHSSPAIYSGNQTLVLFGSTDGFVRALEVFNNGALAWETGFGIPVQSGITVDPQTSRAYFGTDAGQVVAVQADTGQVVWTFQASGAVTSSPALDTARNQVIVGSDDFKVYALDAATGALNWEYATSSYVRSSPTVDASGRAYVGSCDGNMYALDAGSGSELFQFPLSSGVIVASPTVGTDGLVYLGSTNTFLYLIGPDPFAGGQKVMAPRLDSLTPSRLMQGETAEISVRGRDLTEGVGLELGPGIVVESTELVSPTEIMARVRLSKAAPLGVRDVQTRRDEGLPSSRLGGLEVTFDCRRADMTGDGTVDGLDLVQLAGRFGSETEGRTAVDLDGDGRVDGADLALLAARFGRARDTCR